MKGPKDLMYNSDMSKELMTVTMTRDEFVVLAAMIHTLRGVVEDARAEGDNTFDEDNYNILLGIDIDLQEHLKNMWEEE